MRKVARPPIWSAVVLWICLCSFAYFLWVQHSYETSLPRRPDVANGRIIPMNLRHYGGTTPLGLEQECHVRLLGIGFYRGDKRVVESTTLERVKVMPFLISPACRTKPAHG